MRMLKAGVFFLALVLAMALPVVAGADDVRISAISADEVTVSTSDFVYMSVGWIEILAPGFVLRANKLAEISFCVYEGVESEPTYCGGTEDGAWGDVTRIEDSTDPAEYPSPNMPLRVFRQDWRYDFGHMPPGDYRVEFTEDFPKTLVAWAEVGEPRRPFRWGPETFFNEFVIHVVPE